jgi:hypothetical protein
MTDSECYKNSHGVCRHNQSQGRGQAVIPLDHQKEG